MVEWYRVGDTVAEGMRLFSDLSETIFSRGPAERLTYAEAFERYVLSIRTCQVPRPHGGRPGKGRRAPDSLEAEDRDGWLDLLWQSASNRSWATTGR